MQLETLELQSNSPGTRHDLQILRFGRPGAAPKAYIQGALHADEVPAILVTRQLEHKLLALEAEGKVLGEVVLVPFANPLGLSQQLMGQHQGRFDLRDGRNFNRGFADLTDTAARAVQDALVDDSNHNTALIRAALRAGIQALAPGNHADDLRKQLLRLAIDADIVLDLHCDSDAVMHLYALTPQRAAAEQLGAALGAQAVLLATDSGGWPFDEACSRPWYLLQQRFAARPIDLACFAATVELRGETDTSHELANRDADGLIDFLRQRGVLVADEAQLVSSRCEATPLEASEPITAPHAGVVVFHRVSGERVVAGDAIVDLVSPASGAITTLRCASGGVMYARCGSRWAHPGKRLAKIAGTTLARSGSLLSP